MGGAPGFSIARVAAGLKLYMLIPGGKSPEEAALWAGEFYTRLVEQENVPDRVLLQLAAERAQAVAAYLAGTAGVPVDRVGIEDPLVLAGDGWPSVMLSFEPL